MSKVALSTEQLILLINRGVVGPKSNLRPLDFGFRGGCYLGSPGKDIFLSLEHLSDVQMKIIAHALAEKFPQKPINNHVHTAACIRYIYGCFEKQGCLRSKEDKQRILSENPDWSLSLKFINYMVEKFEADNNQYGMILHYEMLAHRYGDKAIIEKSKSRLDEMFALYLRCHKLAKKHKSYKHTFTPYYWAAGYYYEMGYMDDAKECYIKCLKYMNKYCPNSSDGYRGKAVTAISRVLGLLPKNDKPVFKKWLLGCKNRVIIKSRSKFEK